MKYPIHSALLLVWLAGIIITAIYDDIIYPMDDGIISIGMVFLFAITLTTLMVRVNRDEQRRKAEKRAARQAAEEDSCKLQQVVDERHAGDSCGVLVPSSDLGHAASSNLLVPSCVPVWSTDGSQLAVQTFDQQIITFALFPAAAPMPPSFGLADSGVGVALVFI